MSLAEQIKDKAIELGFDAVGITDASPLNAEQYGLLADWLAAGCAGQMSYMQRNLPCRTNPANLLENAKSVICVALNYTQPKLHGRIATYACYEDYHPFMKKLLRKLIASVAGPNHKYKICVDSVPLAERALAVRAGLGFIGKNHMLINPELGPHIFLGEIITDLKLPTDQPHTGQCKNCDKCIQACPTAALSADAGFDARKCISYLTIEHKGPIPAALAEKIGDRLFGCDQCVLACPYYKDAPVCKNKDLKFHSGRASLATEPIRNMTESQFASEFADSPIRRLGLEGLKRNARICIANTANH